MTASMAGVFFADGFEVGAGAAADFGGVFEALENLQTAESAGHPLAGVGLRGEEFGFVAIDDALAAPEVPTSNCCVFDESERLCGCGDVVFDKTLRRA